MQESSTLKNVETAVGIAAGVAATATLGIVGYKMLTRKDTQEHVHKHVFEMPKDWDPNVVRDLLAASQG